MSKPDKVSSSGVHSLGLSDHSLIYLIRKNKKVKVPPKFIKTRSFKKLNDHDFVETIKQTNWNNVLDKLNVNDAYNTFQSLFDNACDQHCPIKEKQIKGSFPEWINGDYIKLCKDRDYYFSRAHKFNNDDDWKMARHLRNKANKLNRSLKKNYCTKAINDNVNNSKMLWNTIKKLIPKNNSSVSSVRTHAGFTTSNKETADQFNSYFTSIGNTLASRFKFDDTVKFDHCNTNDINNNTDKDNDHFKFDIITPDFVFDEICNFSGNKSSGIDNVCMRLLKLAAPIVCHPLAYICNLSLFTSHFPSKWKVAKVTPIYKDGDKSDVSNYRPISVLPILSKILERVVHDQLYEYLTRKNILHPCQSGFRSNHSTNTTLIDVTEYILNNMNEGKVTGAIFLDLKKAFDTVSHKLLLKKLNSYGITGNSLQWFKSYLEDRSQAVNINSTLSDFRHINIGIPQGSILGPLLFIVFVNSLPDSVKSKCVMYADDTTLLTSSSDPLTLETDLKRSLDMVANWFNSNQLTLNIKKTKLMMFGTWQALSKFKDIRLTYDNNNIEIVDKFKYLGVVFDPHLSWTEHVNYMSSNISKRIGVIRRVQYYLPSNTANLLAKAMVFPHFDYCSPVWSNFTTGLHNHLQILQNKLARVLLHADIRTPIDKMMEELNWLKLDDRWKRQLLVVTFKCLKEIAPVYMSSYVTFTHSTHNRFTRNQSSNTLFIPSWNITAGKRTFQYRAATNWNKLPVSVRSNFSDMSLNEFKGVI